VAYAICITGLLRSRGSFFWLGGGFFRIWGFRGPPEAVFRVLGGGTRYIYNRKWAFSGVRGAIWARIGVGGVLWGGFLVIFPEKRAPDPTYQGPETRFLVVLRGFFEKVVKYLAQFGA